jgi:hypothetical protein
VWLIKELLQVVFLCKECDILQTRDSILHTILRANAHFGGLYHAKEKPDPISVSRRSLRELIFEKENKVVTLSLQLVIHDHLCSF